MKKDRSYLLMRSIRNYQNQQINQQFRSTTKTTKASKDQIYQNLVFEMSQSKPDTDNSFLSHSFSHSMKQKTVMSDQRRTENMGSDSKGDSRLASALITRTQQLQNDGMMN